MRRLTLLVLVCLPAVLKAQELYPFSEPASNMPSQSISLKLSAMYGKSIHTQTITQRYIPEIMLGLNKKWMAHVGVSFSDMHQPKFYFESIRAYVKYRFLSNDELHKHFRMAAFLAGSYSRNHLDHNELSLMGDHSGLQAGLIATQLKNKFAASASLSVIEVFDKLRWDKSFQQQYAYQSLNYSISTGYLLFPIEYKDFNQINVNLYLEGLGSYNFDWSYEQGFFDLAPAVQFIFHSTGKLNLGYRFQVAGDVYRLMDNSFMISYEHIFLNSIKKK